MTYRTFNGWTALNSLPPGRFKAPNGKTVYVRDDDVATVFAYIAERWHKEIEPLPPATYNEWPKERSGLIVIHGWRPPNTTVGTGNMSNHRSGTAVDINGHLHPYEATNPPHLRGSGYRDGFTPAQRATLRKIANSVKGPDGKTIIRLGIDFSVGKRDGMHVEIAPGVTADDVRFAANTIRARRTGLTPRPPKGIRASIETGRRAPALTKVIQQRVSYFVPQPVDGTFGPKTEAGVKRLQKALGVKQDGIVGPATVKADLAFRGTLRRGSRNAQVRWVQYVVGVERDGVYGPLTEKAVKERQAWAGITPDGVFGPQSRDRLIVFP